MILSSLGKGALHNLFNEKTLNFPATKKAFKGINGSIDEGSLNLCRLMGEFEFPIQVPSLPTLLMKCWHDHLRKTIDGDFVCALSDFFTPRFAMVGELLFNLCTVDIVPAMVAVAKAIWTVKGGQGHWTGSGSAPHA